MLDITSHNGPKPKCYFTHAVLSNFIDYDQPPTKKRPFTTIAAHTASHTVNVLLPKSSLPKLLESLGEGEGALPHARVHMKLSDIIEGDFFSHYVKAGNEVCIYSDVHLLISGIGNIVMLSQGRPGIDPVYLLSEGMLRLEVNKVTYERMGLEGKVIPGEGRKHVKARFAVEINLRLPSMVRGKPGFDRVVWAFRNVLNHSVTWLFHDLEAKTDGSGPIAVHQPLVRKVEPIVEELDGAVMFATPESLEQDDHSLATELLEWVTMAANLSPRLQRNDSIDSYLSKYNVTLPTSDGDASGHPETQDLVRIRWHGLAHASFVSKVFMTALKACGDDWFAISATSFSGEAYVILKTGERTLTWEYLD
ncbi:hypothetical protein LTR35_015877 [Friedmanniomyces endolithicus]|uniref:Uncharacterized protein n=1 Tax=Friedmanniomyces endolithicus TaxID=329885 RepID=A0AAN6F9A1_9PEZI|nr:hypothetical protein LTR35_015877 [Friedmanniomyces endolithicus]KAK0275464.1 hypothetical protein LTS00_015010 [Friedmanniomyces endolithicus]KAK0307296.1 hypothetical protein LTR82_016014 [Friedmanniomyces endolithicus]KAK0979347.1 hypothetical protein LTR54_015616 [Friedmanniomyces endolithicus]